MCHLYSKIFIRLFICLLTALLVFTGSHAHALSLQQAEQIAVQADPAIAGLQATSRAFNESAVAEGTLDDPKLRLGVVNVPTDTFNLEQEQMTQVKIGIQQNFPRGDSLALKQQQSRSLSDSALARAEDTRLKIIRDVRENYLNLYYETAAGRIITETRKLFSELVKITESNYAAGRVNQQDVISADLELSRLDDRSTKIKSEEESYRAKLAQWLGEAAWYDISSEFPELPLLPENIDLNMALTNHPLIRAESANIQASKQNIEMSRQQYKPGWNLVLDYGYRSGNNPDGTERADFATAIVTMDMPLFTGTRQDRALASSEHKAAAAQYEKDDRLRQLRQVYDVNQHLWQRLGEREKLYKNSLLSAAQNNARAALSAYQSGVSEFNTLMRAKITELDVRLEDLRVRVDRAIAQARVLYAIGGNVGIPAGESK